MVDMRENKAMAEQAAGCGDDGPEPRIVESSFEPDTLAWCGIDAAKVPDLPKFLDECAAKFEALSEDAMAEAAWRAAEAMGLDQDAISMDD